MVGEGDTNGSHCVAPGIFRAYDIRGIVGEDLTAGSVYRIARAFATLALDAGRDRIVIGGDGRRSTGALRHTLARGLRDAGAAVIDIGLVPTPLLYYATHALGTKTGIMVTGSHNAPEYNGLKMMLGGVTLAGEVAPRLVSAMGCQVESLYAEVDGDFPNHHPDPAEPANLTDLIGAVRRTGADIGLAFDGDADRLGVVTDQGQIIWPDRLMMLFSRDVLAANPGAKVIFDVKCSRLLGTFIRDAGGCPVMWKTGHSHIKAKIRASGALLGGEFSGHICFADRWYGFDDALYAAARLVQLLAAEPGRSSAVFDALPVAMTTPEIKVPTTERRKFGVVDAFAENAAIREGAARVTAIDGIRVDYEDGWGLLRASNTSPMLSLRFEADNARALDRIQGVFDRALAEIDPALSFRALRNSRSRQP